MIEVKNILDVEKHLDEVDGVIFDLDDTLYSEKEYVRSGYHIIAELFPQIQDMEDKLWNVFENDRKAIDEVFASEGLLKYKAKALQAYRYQTPDIQLYSGVTELLNQLKKQGKRLGLITDGRPEGQNAKIDALNLRTMVDEIIITDELGGIEFRKPNGTAFRLMQQRLNIPFERIVYIGDNPNKDFIAPRNLGMRCIWFRNQDGLYSKL